jgi:hypothetical protein
MAQKPFSIIDLNPGRSVYLLVNLLPLIGVVFYNWDPHRIFTVYCLETIIIGFFTVLKMILVGWAQPKHTWNNANGQVTTMSTLGIILFFILHYGLFVAVQTGIFFSIAEIGDISPFSGYRELFAYLQNREILIMLGAFVFSYAITDLGFFIANKKYRDEPMVLVMFSPYGRIIIQQFVVILGGFMLQFFPGVIFMAVFILVKIYVESYLRFDERIRVEFLKKTGEQKE